MSVVLVSDFDGTITKIDFFYHIIDRLLEEKDLTPWADYHARKITHFDALNKIFQKIHVTTEELHDLILEMPVEECFVDTVKFCGQNNIDIYIVSAGADYYINFILDRLGIRDKIHLIVNESDYSPGKGLQMFRIAEDSPFYSYNYGIDKGKVVQYLKNKYDKVIFTGDGNPDLSAARHADVVFARGVLLEHCRENGITTRELNSYCDILGFLNKNFV